MNLLLVRDLLEAEGYTVLQAATAEDALALVRQRSDSPPDLILMDISLPGMSGLEATRQLTKPINTRTFLDDIARALQNARRPPH